MKASCCSKGVEVSGLSAQAIASVRSTIHLMVLRSLSETEEAMRNTSRLAIRLAERGEARLAPSEAALADYATRPVVHAELTERPADLDCP